MTKRKRRSACLSFRVYPELRAALECAAHKRGAGISEEIVMRLAWSLEKAPQLEARTLIFKRKFRATETRDHTSKE